MNTKCRGKKSCDVVVLWIGFLAGRVQVWTTSLLSFYFLLLVPWFHDKHCPPIDWRTVQLQKFTFRLQSTYPSCMNLCNARQYSSPTFPSGDKANYFHFKKSSTSKKLSYFKWLKILFLKRESSRQQWAKQNEKIMITMIFHTNK